MPRKVASRGRRTPEEAKREIIESAREYLSQHGFRDLTVGKLMERTQIGRSAFYVYFEDIYDLARVFIRELSDRVQEAAADWFNHEGSPLERIRAGLMNGISFWEENGRMIRALELAAQQDERLRRLWRDQVAVLVKRVATAILRDQAAGLIVPMDAHEISVALNGFNVSYLNECFGTGRPKNREKVLETMERVWIGTLYGRVPASRGLSRRKGR